MSTLFLILFFAAVAIAVLYRAIRSQDLRAAKDPMKLIQPLDIDAFNSLTDPRQEQFLSNMLPVKRFRRAQRERTKVTLLYVQALASNASRLQILAGAAVADSDPKVAAAGLELSAAATRLRTKALKIEARLYIALLTPRAPISCTDLIDEYSKTKDLASMISGSRKMQVKLAM
jgi:hypothetical protein